MFFPNLGRMCIQSHSGERRRIQDVLQVSETYEAYPKVLTAAHL